MNYYNEFHPPAAAILRGLIADKLIPEGHVDDRSITDVQPSDLDGYAQCHFFAGIGGWPYAMQLAGWPADRPVWTGSCPCQPFSTAGRQKGKADERHLWPVWYGLLRQCRPATVFGEQVASAVAHGWLDDVYQGLEAEGYAVGSAVLPACSVGAPHRRDRLWFVANAQSIGRKQWNKNSRGRDERDGQSKITGLGDNDLCVRTLADTEGGQTFREGQRGFQPEFAQFSNAKWLTGADGKSRPVMPGVRLLANGFPERVACLHGFGNAIVPQVAAEFIKAYMNIDRENINGTIREIKSKYGDLYVEVK